MQLDWAMFVERLSSLIPWRVTDSWSEHWTHRIMNFSLWIWMFFICGHVGIVNDSIYYLQKQQRPKMKLAVAMWFRLSVASGYSYLCENYLFAPSIANVIFETIKSIHRKWQLLFIHMRLRRRLVGLQPANPFTWWKNELSFAFRLQKVKREI